MNDTARTMLARLVALYGVSIAHDANRCEGLLRDTCPECSREIFVLVHAVRQHVTDDLLTPRHTLPLALTEAFLVKRLEDELGFSNDVARWAVTSWAEALGRADPAPAPHATRTVPEVSPGAGTDPALRAHWAEDLARASRPVRLGIIANLAETPESENIRLLISSLENDDWAVRGAAFDVLCDPRTRAVTLLTDALHEAPDGLTWRIVLALGALRARDAVGSLIPLLGRSQVVRDATIWALGEIGDRRATTPLMDLVRNADSGAVQAAEEALRKIAG
ncbi:HEAT repeat domain-containing protein [Methanoregula sp.]|uniref:HEAT repeat domain-containing protein n=1 Tax=Methanoregula sp. TaxID=2052170 RepID=UPI002C6114DF|nr:HEAT repeat domain-containing protein [Methanoregula sp.]HVP96144.1 HEAT repeat domain-containing protein [Methanoregula sp.]